MTPEDLAAHAYELASQGIPVFPCKLSKQPCTPHGFKNAIDTSDQVRSLFRSFPDAALIGMPTGLRSGIVVVDVDPAGIVWFRQRTAMGRFPSTKVIQTRRGGYHLWYLCPDPPIKNSASKLARGVDTRGEGGYVIIPPSDGYSIVNDDEIAALPKWIPRSLNRKPKVHVPESNGPTSGNLRALERFVEHSHPGERNCRAFWAAARAGEMVRAGTVSMAEAHATLVAAAMRSGLDDTEAQIVATSGLRRGQMEQRSR